MYIYCIKKLINIVSHYLSVYGGLEFKLKTTKFEIP